MLRLDVATETSTPIMIHHHTTMFYDGGCPRCLLGVRHYRRLDWARRLRWVDLIKDRSALEPHGVDFATAMEGLHVLDRDGRVLSGIDAFSAVWAELPYYRHLAKVFRPRTVRRVADGVYRLMTRGRYRRRCGASGCSAGPGR